MQSSVAHRLTIVLGIALLPSLSQAEDDAKTAFFMTQVKPLIEGTCIHCHGPDEAEGDYRMDNREAAIAGGDSWPDETIVAGDPDASAVYWMTTGAVWPEGVILEEQPRIDFKVNILPLLSKGGPFTDEQKRLMRLWVDQGAVWPADFTLGDAGAADGPGDNIELIEQIRENILEITTEKSQEDMADYTNTIPKTGVKYEMVAIPGGEFLMGSPDDEEGRFEDEGPQHPVSVEPFWMGKFEVTWNMYEPFMITSVARNKDGSPEKVADDAEAVDIVSSPTSPYTEMSFGMGTDGFPAICMTQHAAMKFCQWLSAQTGHYYRLPTEAEWEYACRAGTTGPFSCAPEELAEYAVMDPEQVRVGYEKVGTKKPNPWGLHDMHGNVMEWVIDQYIPNAYESRSGGNTVISPVVMPTQLYPRVARGGSWYDPPEELRSARRIASDESWKVQDPQLPKSIWYHTDAQWLGFRLVRPLKVPDAKKMEEIWNIGIPEE